MQINVAERLSNKFPINIECLNKSRVRTGCRRSITLNQVVVSQMSNSKGVSLRINHSTLRRELTIGIAVSVFELLVE